MKRTSMQLTDAQYDALKKIMEETGLPMGELIRRAIDIFIRGSEIFTIRREGTK